MQMLNYTSIRKALIHYLASVGLYIISYFSMFVNAMDQLILTDTELRNVIVRSSGVFTSAPVTANRNTIS